MSEQATPGQTRVAVEDVKYKRLITVPMFTEKINGISYEFTNLSTITVVEGNLYCLKTTSNKEEGKEIEQAAAIIKFKDFVSKPSFEDAPKVFIHHGSSYRIFKKPNAMAHYNQTFYITTGKKPGTGSQILGVSYSGTDKGVVTAQIKFDKTLYSITHYKGKYFIVGPKSTREQEKEGIRRYHIGYVSGSTFVYESSFQVNVKKYYDQGYTFGNDIYYDSSGEKFYITLFIKKQIGDNEYIIEKNLVLCYDFSKKPSNGATLTLARAMGVACDTSKESMFEIEGMECYGGKKYVGSNCKKGDKQADGIFQLYKPS